QRPDQAVNARLGLEIQRILHLVEGGSDAILAQTLMDEKEKLLLFLCQHRPMLPYDLCCLLVLCLFRASVKANMGERARKPLNFRQISEGRGCPTARLP